MYLTRDSCKNSGNAFSASPLFRISSSLGKLLIRLFFKCRLCHFSQRMLIWFHDWVCNAKRVKNKTINFSAWQLDVLEKRAIQILQYRRE